MEYSNLNSISDVEADRASFHPTIESTCDVQRNFAGKGQEYQLSLPPDLTPNAPFTIADDTTTVEFYQCARNRHDSGSGSDSAKEEDSPYSSYMESLKYDCLVLSGKTQQENQRKERTEPCATDNRHGPHIMPRQRSLEVYHGTGPYAMECDVQETKWTVVPTGSSTQQVRQAKLLPRGEIETKLNRTVDYQKELYTRRPSPPFENLDARLASFLQFSSEWPHIRPSAEQMAKAGLFYKGVVKIEGNNVYDMVTCYKCGQTLYGFVENDDPVTEHRKFYPDCN